MSDAERHHETTLRPNSPKPEVEGVLHSAHTPLFAKSEISVSCGAICSSRAWRR